ncbi:DNA recombination protein RecN [Streptomyces formicae]|uniref:DNA double-strand break repair Rad50 ATPase n=1 Tax=Streptomyces formicae TaxID=1616117 RepID=A0A291QIF9_9ACTN|nr:DNA recombination protein RecN [Streptomyces formicae]ATL31501.1 DNA double-strand break repair Rad50 ATPase [Streptomyces formicae]
MSATTGIRIRRLRLVGVDRNYDVDFTDGGDVRRLSVISGAFSSGKTAVLEFVAYGLGAKRHPRHPEVMRKVRASLLEVELSGVPHVIERAVGEPSTTAFVRKGRLDEPSTTTAERRRIDPAGHAESLSTLLLSHCGLEGVQLREAPTSSESRTDPLSFRDLMWLTFLTNERVADKNFLFENSYMRKHKLRQVVDVVFAVHDDRRVEIGSRIKELENRLGRSRSELTTARSFVEEQNTASTGAQTRLDVERKLADITRELEAIDAQARAATDFATQLRARHNSAAQEAQSATAVLRDHQTQLARMLPLRAQYADDLLKLGMLAQAKHLFDPLRVRTCPACLQPLQETPHTDGGQCSLCHHPVEVSSGSATNLGSAAARAVRPEDQLDVAAETRATKARLKAITTYIEELEQSLGSAERRAVDAAAEEQRMAKALDEATEPVVSTFLSARDELHRRQMQANRQLDEFDTAARLEEALEKRAAKVAQQESQLQHLRDELESLGDAAADRDHVLREISKRYARLLTEWHYPKLSMPHIADDLTPHVRGEPYQEASSGARTLITLAWQLAVFEVAVEKGAAHPGFLMIDSPQKNLGHGRTRDSLIADAVSIEDFYRFLRQWLDDHSDTAQVIIADNSPPAEAEGDVIVQYSRDEEHPPYGLVEDEIG